MGKWLDIKGPVVADTVYADGVLVAKDVSFTLPGIEFLTADVQAMGNLTVPLIGLLENMELTITKIGVDMGLSRLSKLEKQNLEFRWVQNVVKSDGSQKNEGCKAFVRTLPGALPELGVEVGSATEAENTYNVTRQQIYTNGTEYMCVDRLSQILRINGKDYMSEINNLL
jgi:phage tail tube protein FII